jgi:hypothetical protein
MVGHILLLDGLPAEALGRYTVRRASDSNLKADPVGEKSIFTECKP